MSIKKIDDLEIEAEATQKNLLFWKFQKIGIIVMIGIVAAALLGFMGLSPFGKTSISDANKILTVEYQSFIRMYNPTLIRIKINPKLLSPTTKSIPIWISQSYLNGNVIEQQSPKSAFEEISTQKTTYYFPVKNPKDIITINFWIDPRQAGFVTGAIGITDGPAITFKQIIYP